MSNEQQLTVKGKTIHWFDALNDAYQARDLQRLDELADEMYSPDFVMHYPPAPDLPPGVAGVKQLWHMCLQEHTDIHFTVHDIFAAGDRQAMRYTIHAANHVTGRQFHLTLLNISHFVGDKCAEEWEVAAPVIEE